jgi:long-chain acyl-CoA synthetase
LYLSAGASIVLSPGFPAERIINAVEKEKATILYASPFHYALLAADISSRKMSTIRMAISSTVALPESVYIDFQNRFGLTIRQAYGIIETGLVCVNTELPLEKRTSVGCVVPGYEVEIRNIEQSGENDPTCGRIFVKGPGFFDAYFSPFRSAGQILDNGWFDTGDIGRVDSEGYVYILGRYKEIINVAGMKVFPQEVEQVLDEHPAVGESHVFSQDNSRYGETVVAEVRLFSAESRIIESELRSYCRSRLASYKVPETIRFVESIAKTVVTSKIIRKRSGSDVMQGVEDRCYGN